MSDLPLIGTTDPYEPASDPMTTAAAEHDPLTCELCHAEGTGAEIAALAAERDRYREALKKIAGLSVHEQIRVAHEIAFAAIGPRRKEPRDDAS